MKRILENLVSANINTYSHSKGFTIIEVLITVALIGLLIGPVIGGMFFFYGGTVANNQRAGLALEAHTILRSVSQELRLSAGVRENSTINDPNKTGGWSTSNDNLVLIIATPALDGNNDFIFNSGTGQPYQNELVYFAEGTTLYKRILAHPDADGNESSTTCPTSMSSCPHDKVLSDHFKDMQFTFYNQNNQATTILSEARSIRVTITMEDSIFGRTINFENDIRATLRNSLL